MLRGWLKNDLESLLNGYKKDIELINNKNKEEDWKRDHYRYASAVYFQRIFNLLNAQIVENPPAKVSESTRLELIVLKNIIDEMIGDS